MIKKIVQRIIKWIMANYESLKTAIRNAVYENGNNEITGQGLQDVLEAIVNSLGAGYQFASVATTETEPGTPDANVMYIVGAGTYPNFGATKVPQGSLGVFRYNGEWIYSVLDVASWANASNKLYYNTQAGNVAAKTIQADGFTLQPGGWIKIHFNNANEAENPTLNVNNTGAHAMTFNGALVSKTNSWKTGETVAFYYDNYGVGIWQGIRLIDLPDFVNVNDLVGEYTPFASASAARTAIPQQNRKPGLNITYLLSTGENTSQWVQDMFIGDDVTDWSVADNWKVIGPVSVSQNINTGHTDINIGNNQFPVPSIDDTQRVLNAINGSVDALLLNYHKNYYLLDGVITQSSDIRAAGFNYIPVKGGSQVNIGINSDYRYTIQFYTDADEASFIKGTNYVQDTTIDIPANSRYVRFAFRRVDNGEMPISINDLEFTINNNTVDFYAKKSSVNGYANIQDKINSKYNNRIDFGEIGNYYSQTGAYTLVASNERISTMVPIFIGKGNIVHIHLPNGLSGAYNTYPNTNSGVARTTYETFSGDKDIVMSDDYLFLTFYYPGLTRINPDIVTALDSQVYATLERINTEDYFTNEQYGGLESLDVRHIRLSRGSIDNNNGSIFYHVSRLFSEFIPVKPLSRLFVDTPTLSDETRLNCYVHFYHINADGSFRWLSQYSFDSNYALHYAYTRDVVPSFNVVIPPSCNAVRFYLTKSEGNVNYTDVNAEYLTIQCHSRRGFRNVENQYDEITDVVKLNELGCEWVQGLGFFNTVPNTKSRLCNIFKVYPGQRLAIRHNNGNLGFRINIYCWTDIESTNTPTQEFLGRSYTWGYGVFVVPKDIYYISFAESNTLSDDVDITPEKAIEDNWHIFDVTGKPANLQHAEKILDITRASSFAQGMAIQNGYVFQAFADGYVDIYDLHTRDFVQTIQWPYTYTLHGNNIQFSDKYDANDEFGVLWVSTDADDSKIAGFRVQRTNNVFSLTLVYEVTPPVVSETHKPGATQYFDFVAKQMVQFAFKDNPDAVEPNSSGYSDCIISLYSWDGELNNNTAFTFIHTFEFPILWAVQGGRLYDGVLYLLSGPGMNDINIFNVVEKKAIGMIDMTRNCFGNITEELQGIEFADGPYISFTNSSTHHWGLVKLNL